MKLHYYVGIGVRLFAVVLFLISINQLVYLIENIFYGTVQGMDASALVSAAIYTPWLIGAVFLWMFPLSVAKRIVPPEAQLKPEAISPVAILSVLVSAIGLFLLYRSIMDALYWATFWNISNSQANVGYPVRLSPEHKASIIATGIEFIAAALLFFNSKRVAQIASKF